MAKKSEAVKKIDVRSNVAEESSTLVFSSQFLPPATGHIPEPKVFTITNSVVARSTQASQCYINVAWDAPIGIIPEYYIIEMGKSVDGSGVPQNAEKFKVNTGQMTAALLADCGTAYYLRIQAVFQNAFSDFVNAASYPYTTIVDTVPPNDLVTGSATFVQGDGVIIWTELTQEVYKDTEIRIYNSGKTTLYGTYYSRGGRFVWTERDNYRASSGAGVTSIAVELKARGWNNITSANALTVSATLTAPNPVTSVVSDITTCDLFLKWVQPTNTIYRDILVTYYTDNTKTTTIKSDTVVGTVSQLLVEENTPLDVSPYYEIIVRGWLNQSSSTVSGTVTKALPIAPTSFSSTWSGDNGTYPEDTTITWNPITGSGIKDYLVIVNSVSRYVTDPRLPYDYGRNVEDHRATLPSGKFNPAFTIQARDRFNQVGPGLSGVATNIAPSTTHFTVTTQAGFSAIAITATFTTLIQDLANIRYRLYTAGSSTVLFEAIDTQKSYIAQVSGQMTVDAGVTVYDRFGQSSSETKITNISIEGITISFLRQYAYYRDSQGTAQATLDAQMKNNLPDNKTGVKDAGVSYGAGWAWTEARSELVNRHRNFSVASSGSGITIYVAYTMDDSSYTYFSGPLTSGYYLTEQSSLANAQTNALSVSGSQVMQTFSLPRMIDTRHVRLGHNSAATRVINEFYPRRLIQGDDIEAETIKGIHVAANTLTGNNIIGLTLSAVKADLGTVTISAGGWLSSGQTGYDTGTGFWIENNAGTPRLSIGNSGGNKVTWNGSVLSVVGDLNATSGTFSGVVTIGASGGLWQGSGSFASVTTGIKLYNSGGIGKLSSYNAGVEQITIDTDGKLKAGLGTVYLDAQGLNILAGAAGAFDPVRAIRMRDSGGLDVIRMQSSNDGTNVRLLIENSPYLYNSGDTRTASTTIRSYAKGSASAFLGAEDSRSGYVVAASYIDLQANAPGSPNATLTLFSSSITLNSVSILIGLTTSSKVAMNGALGVGNFVGTPGTGDIYAASTMKVGNPTNTPSTNGLSVAGNIFAGTGTAYNASTAGAVHANDWFRSYGATGWYHETYGGGWLMTDTTWVRNYNNKQLLLTSPGLGTTAGATATGMRIDTAATNNIQMQHYVYRHTAGTDYIGVDTVIQRIVDTTFQSYIAFSGVGIGINKTNAAYHLQLGTDSAAKPGTSSWTVVSDKRTKTIIKPYTGSFDVLNAVNPILYEYNGKAETPVDGRQYVGTIAQDLKDIAWVAVEERQAKLNPDDKKNTTLLSITTDELLYATINALKQLKQEFDDYKKNKK